jgi:hypothetical protein
MMAETILETVESLLEHVRQARGTAKERRTFRTFATFNCTGKKFLQDVPAAVISLVAMSGSLCPDDGAAGGFLARICSVMALHAATMNADDVAVCLMITQSEVPHMTLVSLLL